MNVGFPFKYKIIVVAIDSKPWILYFMSKKIVSSYVPNEFIQERKLTLE